ncbi:MAG TPA: ArsA-related P-loop ATPase [Streptosporangiaceae bacterium]|nr:ArsA-related P-loop ATPase [Streptosporangiaceae bacterium]
MLVSVRDTDWDGVRLHVVTGKGGTGKTTVAAALALALASNGKPVLLIEVEGRQGIAQVFDVPPLPYEERRVAVAPANGERPGGDVFALSVDPQSALIEYLEMFYNLRQAGRALTKLGVLDFATTIAPGLSDVLLTGKAAEAVRRKSAGSPVYGAVVMDAPPTGRISRFLNVTSEVSGLAKVGPIRGHADTVQNVIRSPLTAVHFVTLLEEMPVQETLDGIAELSEVGHGGIQPGGIFVNMMREAEVAGQNAQGKSTPGKANPGKTTLGSKARDTHALEVALKAAGLGEDAALAADLADELADEARTARSQRAQRRLLDQAGQPCYELPLITDGIDLAALYRLAEALRDQGAA